MAWTLGLAALLPSLASAQRPPDDRRDDGPRPGWDRRGDDRRDRDGRDRDRDRDRNWDRDRESDRRQGTKNQWRDLGILGGALGVVGLLGHNRTLATLGIGGGLYSAYRYEQDRRSQNRDDRDRYELFRQRGFDHQGHHYERRERDRDGQKYYYFQRTR